MVFVPFNERFEECFVVFLITQFIRIDSATEVQAHCREFINDYDALSVTELIHLLCIRIVAGSEGISSEPMKKSDIHQILALIDATPSGGGVLMLSNAFEIERFAVYEEFLAFYFHGPDAETHLIAVIFKMHHSLVEIGSARFGVPELCRWNQEFSLCFTSIGYCFAFFINN
jgi:hypothetical protein